MFGNYLNPLKTHTHTHTTFSSVHYRSVKTMTDLIAMIDPSDCWKYHFPQKETRSSREISILGLGQDL